MTRPRSELSRSDLSSFRKLVFFQRGSHGDDVVDVDDEDNGTNTHNSHETRVNPHPLNSCGHTVNTLHEPHDTRSISRSFKAGRLFHAGDFVVDQDAVDGLEGGLDVSVETRRRGDYHGSDHGTQLRST